MEKQCWIPTGTGNTVVLCVLWRLHVEDQGGVARAQKQNAHRQTVVRMSFGKRYRRGAPCQRGRLEGYSKFPLLPHSPISYSPFLPSPTPSWDTSPALTATKIWQSGNLLLPFPPPFWACLCHTPRPGPTGCTLGSRDHTQTGLAPHELCFFQEPQKASSGRRDFCLSQSKLLAVGLLSNPGHLRHISRSQQWGLEASRSERSGRTLCLAYTVLSFSVGAVKRSLSFSIGGRGWHPRARKLMYGFWRRIPEPKKD